MLKVTKIFQTIQGEGDNKGLPFIFIRLSGCNLICNYCDTDFESSIGTFTEEQILQKVKEVSSLSRVLITGGEPLSQDIVPLARLLTDNGYYIALETNGSYRIPTDRHALFDYVTVSPKVSLHVVKRNIESYTGELEFRYPIGKDDTALPEAPTTGSHYFLSPVFNGDVLEKEVLEKAIDLVTSNTTGIPWRLSVQMHKLIGVD